VKAEPGFHALLPALHSCFPDVTFALGSVRIYSTKEMEGASVGFITNNPADGEHLADVIRERGGVDPALTLRFAWSLRGGLEWLQELGMPEEVSALLYFARTRKSTF
jgi:hypothetical protein